MKIFKQYMLYMISMSIDNLINLISRIPYCSLSYLTYKINKEHYKNLLGIHFYVINDDIEHLKTMVIIVICII